MKPVLLIFVGLLFLPCKILGQNEPQVQGQNNFYLQGTAMFPYMGITWSKNFNSKSKVKLLTNLGFGFSITDGYPTGEIGLGFNVFRKNKKANLGSSISYYPLFDQEGGYWIWEMGFDYIKSARYLKIAPGIMVMTMDQKIWYFPLPTISVGFGLSKGRKN